MPRFIFVADRHYQFYLELSLAAIRKWSPDAPIDIYDVSVDQGIQLPTEDKNVHVTKWDQERWLTIPWINELDFTYFHPHWSFSEQCKYLSRKLRHFLNPARAKNEWMTDKKSFLQNKKRIIHIWAQKALCIQDALKKQAEDIIFLDADAMLWTDPAHLFEEKFDVALTVREQEKIKIGRDPGICASTDEPYHCINAGVIIMRNTAASHVFVEKWIEEMQVTRHFMVEQTALSRLALQVDPTIFDHQDGIKISVAKNQQMDSWVLAMLPCAIYNNTSIKPRENEQAEIVFDVPAQTRVAHFKGHLKNERYKEALSKFIMNK